MCAFLYDNNKSVDGNAKSADNNTSQLINFGFILLAIFSVSLNRFIMYRKNLELLNPDVKTIDHLPEGVKYIL